jgi:hypothetical protein
MLSGWLASQRLELGKVAEADYVLRRITEAVEGAVVVTKVAPER